MSNILTEDDIDLFYRIYHALIGFVNRREVCFDLPPGREAIMGLNVEERFVVRDTLFESSAHIDAFLQSEDVATLSPEELEIAKSWRHFHNGTFFIYKHLKRHSIFVDEKKRGYAYAVRGISDRLDEMFPFVPYLAEAVLLPFKGSIVYDGLIRGQEIYFGPSMSASITSHCEAAKHQFGLVTTLPIRDTAIRKSDIETLKFYMKNKSNRAIYSEEIDELAAKSPELTNLYYREMGKAHAPHFSRQLKRLGIQKTWFGIIDNTVVASGKSKPDVERSIERLFGADTRERVHLFKT